jgi:hypothetical protein
MIRKLSWVVLLALAGTVPARAALTFFPDSHDQQFHTYGLYIDNQSDLLVLDSKRAWGALAGAFAILENDSWGHPQLVLGASANAAFRFNAQVNTLLTETIDARVGLALQFSPEKDFRFMLGWQHQSGHIADNVPDPSLIGSNLGNEIFYGRVVKDFEDRWRVGGELKPFVGTDPAMKAFGADQFAEWFPWGVAGSRRQASPFLAGGLEQYGRDFIQLCGNVQAGVVFGNHFKAEHEPTLRAVLGYYWGNDPRLKFYEFDHQHSDFAYTGLEVEF